MITQFPILVLDDDPSLIDILSSAAKSSFPEASFTQVYRVEEAKKYILDLDGSGPKLVLVDIDLKSEEDGLNFLDFLQAHPIARFIPVIVVTVSQTPLDVKNTYLRGASSFLVKPMSLEGWKNALVILRQYWLETTSLPTIQFTKTTS